MESSQIYIDEAAVLLKMDSHGVIKWCERYGITVYSDGVHEKKYMSRIQIEYAMNMDLIGQLQKEHGDQWLSAYKACMDLNLFPHSF